VGQDQLQLHRKAVGADLADARARLEGCDADSELVGLALACLAPKAADRPRDAQAVADALTAHLDGVQERLHKAELAEAAAKARLAEEAKRRRLALALAGCVLALVALGSLTPPFVLERLRPGFRADPRRVSRLIAGLSSEEWRVRHKASEELAKFVESAEPSLRRALAATRDLEVRLRLKRLLHRPDPTPEKVRFWRAVEVLERIGTAKAREVLRFIAREVPGGWQEREATAALQRLSKPGRQPARSVSR
jgi:hypothetical protein